MREGDRRGGVTRRVAGPGLLAPLALLFRISAGSAQLNPPQVNPPPPPTQDSVDVIPGAVYAANGLYRSLFGSGYRDLWTTPIRVPVADMSTLGNGGLTPVEVGGGVSTQTLHLLGADGFRYVFRSVDKTPRELIEDLEGTRAEAIIQDQMSSFHPSGALIAERFMEAIGVLHTHPQLMVIPDDPRLGEFREQFAGMLVLFEERPDDLPEGRAGFAGSTRIEQTDDFMDELEEGPENRLDVDELLRLRLVDILMGDRDRSHNNHLWARFEEAGGYLWRVIPRDRDQAFVQFDGFLKALARRYEFRLVPFRAEYADTGGVTRNAWDIDRSFLVAIDRERWERTVAQVMSMITDDVIHEAVDRMPLGQVAVIGAEMEAKLRRRRDELPRVAEDLYDIVFRFADIQATDIDEIALVEALPGGRLRVALSRRGESDTADGAPYFDRTFSPGETKEIRFYLHGGDDLTRLQGEVDSPITLRIVGGGGADELVNESATDVTFYDGGDQTVVEGQRVERVDESPSRAFSWFEETRDLDWGSLTTPLPGFSYDSDRGMVPMIGIQHLAYGFNRRPYHYRFSLQGGWALEHGKPILESTLFVRKALAGADLRLDALYSGIEVVNFFGYGNQTESDFPDAYYEVDQEQLGLSARVSVGNGESWEASVGPTFKRVVSDTTGAPNFLAEAAPFGVGTVSQLGLIADASWDGRDLAGAPTRGFRVEGSAGFYPSVGDLEEAFGFVGAEVSTYLSPPGWENPTLALRVGGEKLWGEHPYYESAFLGGSHTLRGLREERYAGDAMLYASAEVRAFLARLTFILPIDMGVFGFGDMGRVYASGQTSDDWHTGRGLGLWLAPLSRASTVRVSFASSEGRTAWYAGVGFAF